MANNIRQLNKHRAAFVDGIRHLADQAESGELEGVCIVAFTKSDAEPDLMVGGAFSKFMAVGALEELKLVLHETE